MTRCLQAGFRSASYVPAVDRRRPWAGCLAQGLRVHGVSATLRTSGLPAGDAVTMWWVVFNNPDACEGAAGVPLRCAESDLFNEDVAGSVQYAGGNVVGGSGHYSVGSYLSVGDTSGCAFGPGFLCAGLIDAREADIHLVVRSHGPKLAEFMPGQIMSFGVACTPGTSEGLGDGPNDCEDLQAATHETL
jgi:hypothetical protein